MARPAKFERQDAIQKAIDTIWKNGFERSSVKNLSETLGMTRSSFYNAFGSREDLFREAIPAYARQAPYARLTSEITPPILPVIAATLHDICRIGAADPEGRGCMIQNTVNELCPDSDPDSLGADLAKIVAGSIDRIEELLTIAKHEGELPADADTRMLALSVQNLMMGLNVLGKVLRDEDALWSHAQMMLRGLGLYPEKGDTAPRPGVAGE